MKSILSLILNGRQREDAVADNLLLLDYIREVAGLTGTKQGCDGGECGACTVKSGNKTIYSCSTLLLSFLAAPILQLGLVYLFNSILIGSYLMFKVFNLYQSKTTPGLFFSLSNTYLALLFLGIVLDVAWTLRLSGI